MTQTKYTEVVATFARVVSVYFDPCQSRVSKTNSATACWLVPRWPVVGVVGVRWTALRDTFFAALGAVLLVDPVAFPNEISDESRIANTAKWQCDDSDRLDRVAVVAAAWRKRVVVWRATTNHSNHHFHCYWSDLSFREHPAVFVVVVVLAIFHPNGAWQSFERSKSRVVGTTFRIGANPKFVRIDVWLHIVPEKTVPETKTVAANRVAMNVTITILGLRKKCHPKRMRMMKTRKGLLLLFL